MTREVWPHRQARTVTPEPGPAHNRRTLANGRFRVLCEFCGRASRATYAERPTLWDLPTGWSECPFPGDFQHADGSTGSTYACPPCTNRTGPLTIKRDRA